MVTITTRFFEGVPVMDLHGRFLADSQSVLWNMVQNLVVEEGARQLLLNFTEVEVCDSFGISELMRLHNALQNMSGKLVIYGANPLIQRVFEITKVNEVFYLAPDAYAALDELNPLAVVE